MKKRYKNQKEQGNKRGVFASQKNKIKIKSTQLINSRLKVKRISKNIDEPELCRKKKINKVKERQGPIMPRTYGNIFYFNDEYIENFIHTSFSIIIYLKQKAEKGEF